MSKLNVRVLLSVLISLGVIFAVYTTVQSASFDSAAEKIGSHSVSGLMTNFNHDRFTVAEQEMYQSELESNKGIEKGSGHGCESEARNSPLD
jgi:hypothetical protein